MTAPRASPGSTVPVGATIATGEALEVAYAIAKSGPSCATVAGPHHLYPLVQVSKMVSPRRIDRIGRSLALFRPP
jgi:hypothetical protein